MKSLFEWVGCFIQAMLPQRLGRGYMMGLITGFMMAMFGLVVYASIIETLFQFIQNLK